METDIVNWSIIRARLAEVSVGHIQVTDRMTVVDIENALQPFRGEVSVADALRELECHKRLAAGLAQRQARSGNLCKGTISRALHFCAASQRWLRALYQRE